MHVKENGESRECPRREFGWKGMWIMKSCFWKVNIFWREKIEKAVKTGAAFWNIINNNKDSDEEKRKAELRRRTWCGVEQVTAIKGLIVRRTTRECPLMPWLISFDWIPFAIALFSPLFSRFLFLCYLHIYYLLSPKFTFLSCSLWKI